MLSTQATNIVATAKEMASGSWAKKPHWCAHCVFWPPPVVGKKQRGSFISIFVLSPANWAFPFSSHHVVLASFPSGKPAADWPQNMIMACSTKSSRPHEGSSPEPSGHATGERAECGWSLLLSLPLPLARNREKIRPQESQAVSMSNLWQGHAVFWITEWCKMDQLTWKTDFISAERRDKIHFFSWGELHCLGT